MRKSRYPRPLSAPESCALALAPLVGAASAAIAESTRTDTRVVIDVVSAT